MKSKKPAKAAEESAEPAKGLDRNAWIARALAAASMHGKPAKATAEDDSTDKK